MLVVLLHKTGKTTFGSLDQKWQAAFAAAIERAVLDPAYGARRIQAAGRQPPLRPPRALVQAAAARPLDVNATQNVGP